MFLSGHAVASFERLERHGLLPRVPAETAQALPANRSGALRRMLIEGLRSTDARVANDEPVSPAFLFAVLLWPAYCRDLMGNCRRRACMRPKRSAAPPIASPAPAQHDRAAASLLAADAGNLAAAVAVRQRQRKRVFRLLSHPRFRAAFDFLVLRQHASPEHAEDIAFWADVQTQPGEAVAAQLEAQRDRSRRIRRRTAQASSPSPRPSGETQRVISTVQACVGLGANLGDAVAAVQGALQALDALPDTRVLRASRLYRTPAWGKTDQPAFVNAAALLDTHPGRARAARRDAVDRARFGRDRAAKTSAGARARSTSTCCSTVTTASTNPACTCRTRTCTSAPSRWCRWSRSRPTSSFPATAARPTSSRRWSPATSSR
jgi:2-amino-4-hydroxy-6-hydroxymethyldihydropteridine diphosphokinase